MVNMTNGEQQLLSTEFEVYGHVQGCYFTKYAKEQAEVLGIVGWVKNAKTGTILGKIQGSKPQVEEMIQWLTKTGSPGCSIEKCDTRNYEVVARTDFRNFSIRF